MTESTTQTNGLEDLLERRLPSALHRHDAELSSSGIPDHDLRATKNAIAAVGAVGVAPKSPPSSLRDRLLASASKKRTGKYGIFSDRIARLFDLPLSEAEELMARIEKPEAWNPFIVEGVEMIPIVAGPKCAGAIATLVRIQPGTTFPAHAHRGDETMLVLDGGFVEPEGSTLREEAWRGDEVFRTNDTEHSLVGLPGTPCVAAVVIFGHADFK
jgi:quercetin dioxygenase-like cupin family protein